MEMVRIAKAGEPLWIDKYFLVDDNGRQKRKDSVVSKRGRKDVLAICRAQVNRSVTGGLREGDRVNDPRRQGDEKGWRRIRKKEKD